MTTSPISRFDRYNLRHRCGAPGCTRRVTVHYFCCGQHRSHLGFELNVRLQTAYQERRWDPQRWESTRTEAFRSWGWKPEYVECPAP